MQCYEKRVDLTSIANKEVLASVEEYLLLYAGELMAHAYIDTLGISSVMTRKPELLNRGNGPIFPSGVVHAKPNDHAYSKLSYYQNVDLGIDTILECTNVSFEDGIADNVMLTVRGENRDDLKRYLVGLNRYIVYLKPKQKRNKLLMGAGVN